MQIMLSKYCIIELLGAPL